jgi:hypothetical protein
MCVQQYNNEQLGFLQILEEKQYFGSFLMCVCDTLQHLMIAETTIPLAERINYKSVKLTKVAN